ncbi:NnrS family protein [Thiomicrospira sp. R3]|uniref:NnrS family protein n=1 Tax=Thiomicrospira sp. R3 TaxID=3035472 RepID=UPI00259B1454|nr:NnrS family protein [Thiomicrospira sp. R3]WFE69198.1 NnrS family protein [Thiomicrospira sp. R3]
MKNDFFFERAFRSFFVGGVGFAVVAMAVWWWQFPQTTMGLSGVSGVTWHAHEMVFGYALAIVAGFLLTAVMNWSGMNTASGWRLGLVVGFWLAARLGYLLDLPISWVALFDLAFNLGLVWHFAWPVWKKRLRAQAGLVVLFMAVFMANASFYLNVHQAWPWVNESLILGLFLVLTINLTMIRRLVPFFTEKALGLAPFKNSNSLDKAVIIGFLGLMLVVVFSPITWLISLLAWPLALLFVIRQAWWYHPKIWSQLLLWPLHISHGFILLGLVLYGFVGLGWLPSTLAVHALAAGGIGLLCSAMMARISLGHTQRNVFEPPKGLIWVFVLLILAALFRVVLPIVWPQTSLLWIALSQWSWILGFSLLLVLYWRILTTPVSSANAS